MQDDGNVGRVEELDGVGGVLATEPGTLDGQVHSEPLGGGEGRGEEGMEEDRGGERGERRGWKRIGEEEGEQRRRGGEWDGGSHGACNYQEQDATDVVKKQRSLKG